MTTRHIIASFAICAAMISSCAQHERQSARDGEFRSIIRLWAAHHLSDTLESQLTSAFRRYPGCCDEVWFYDGDPTELSLEEYRRRAGKMAKAAGDMNGLGIIPSFQTISIGHPTENITASAINDAGYRAMTSAEGIHCADQTCPRDTAFLRDLSWRCALYAEAIQPDCLYIDDDLRITSHSPAGELCYCDECLALYNSQNGSSYTRAELKEALQANVPGVRKSWIRFSQESLAVVARAVSKAVHEVSPQTHMGLQHANFHTALMEGWDWNPIFDAMYEETGLAPCSRPGHWYYNDHSPRMMIDKAYGISRQVARLRPDITMIAPEIEGFRHKATGKSAQSLCTETLLYLGMGATSMSYAIICSAFEPMQWYADTYFKALDSYHDLFRSYVAHNKGTKGSGIDSYISPDHVCRNVRKGEAPDAWKSTRAGSEIAGLAPLGIPFTPESGHTSATVLDLEAAIGMSDEDIIQILSRTGTVMDRATMSELLSRDTDFGFTETEAPEGLFGSAEAPEPVEPEGSIPPKGLFGTKYYLSGAGRRIAVLPSFSADLTNAERLDVLHIFDWASDGRMSVILESMAQAVLVPRVSEEDGSLRSVVFVNATISDLPGATLRLRGCPAGSRISWEYAVNDVTKKGASRRSTHSKRLKVTWEGTDAIVTIPMVKAWDAGYVKICR